MALCEIDEQLCRKDGLCSAACPGQLIFQADSDSLPAPIKEAEELCINCGHCVAVCPYGALSLKSMSPADCAPIDPALDVSPQAARQLLLARRSIRVYKDKTVPREVLSELIDAARWAPSGHNSQPVSWMVIQDPVEVQRLAGLVVDWMRSLIALKVPQADEYHMDRIVGLWDKGLDRICRKAPHLILTHGEQDSNPAPTAANIALTYVELYAKALGLGACWAGYFTAAGLFHPPLTKALGLPEGHVLLGSMMIGYPKLTYHRIPERNQAQIIWK